MPRAIGRVGVRGRIRGRTSQLVHNTTTNLFKIALSYINTTQSQCIFLFFAGGQSSYLVTALLELWASKELSARLVQVLADAASNDGSHYFELQTHGHVMKESDHHFLFCTQGLTHTEITKLAGIGSAGRNAQHCSADIYKIFGFGPDAALCPPSTEVQIPVVNPKDTDLSIEVKTEVGDAHIHLHLHPHSHTKLVAIASGSKICVASPR